MEGDVSGDFRLVAYIIAWPFVIAILLLVLLCYLCSSNWRRITACLVAYEDWRIVRWCLDLLPFFASMGDTFAAEYEMFRENQRELVSLSPEELYQLEERDLEIIEKHWDPFAQDLELSPDGTVSPNEE